MTGTMYYGYQPPENLSPEEAARKAEEFCSMAREDEESAEYYYELAIKVKQDHVPAYMGLAILSLENGSFQYVLEHTQKVIKYQPDCVEAYLLQGLAVSAMGNTLGCIKLCEKAIEIDPKFANSYNTLGEMLMELGKFPEALAAYEKTIELNPKHPFVYGNKGYVLSLMGKTDEAIELYNKVLEISPNEFTVWIKKGQALQDSGKLEEALKSFKTAMDLVLKGRLKKLIWKLGSFAMRLNTHEVRLLHCLQDLVRIKEIKAIMKEEEIAELEEKRNRLQIRIFEAFTARQQNDKDEVVKQLAKEVEELKKKTQELEKDIKDSGAKDLAMVKRGFKELEEKDPELLSYCKTFYWTSINLFGAYRTASTGLVKTDNEHGETLADNLLSEGVKKATGAIADVSKGIPFIGGVVSLLNSVIDDLVDVFKENKYQNKVNAINKIIQKKLGLESDISVNVAKVALVITQAKEKTILYPELSERPSNLSKGVNWLTTQIDSIKEKVLPSVELHDPNSRGATLALQDVTLLMAYLAKNSDAVVTRKESLDKQLEAIIQFGGLDKMLEAQSPEEVSKKRPKGGCCQIF